MSTLASIYLASLSNAYRHTYCAQISDLTVTVLRKSEIPPELHSFHHEVEEDFSPSGTLSRYHFLAASMWD